MAPTQKRLITRTREMLACTECRKKKLKCDRNSPCNSCTKRGDQTSCQYQRFAEGSERDRRVNAEARLEHLEQLVQQLAKPQDGSAGQDILTATTFPGGSNHWSNGVGNGNGFQTPVSNNVAYSGSTHWSAMLEDIEELRFAIGPDAPLDGQHDMAESENTESTGLIFGAMAPLPLEAVMSQYLPSRQDADRLTAAYFRAKAVAAPFIHSAQFRRLYQAFWNAPMNAPPLWTSILFSICHVATNTLTLGKENIIEDDKYLTAAAHCLALGKYYRPKRFAVESLLLYAQSKCLTKLDVDADVGVTFGLLVRLATRMGYHRDPESFSMSPFEKEMRRRTWSLCMQLDLLISFQLGLPSNVQFPTWDTLAPRNLLDSDLDESTQKLPPARPDSEPTDILFYIAKHRMMAVFEKILRHSLAIATDNSTEVDRLHIEIGNTYEALPEVLRPRSMAESVVDPPSLIVTRLCVYFIYQKCLCVLHRQYVMRGRAHNIRVCYEAASNMVRYFNDAYAEFRPGGLIEMERWFMGSITWHDYLLGNMALCLVLCATSQQNVVGVGIDSVEALNLLRRSHNICLEQAVRSKDTGRVRKLIEATLSKLGDKIRLQGPTNRSIMTIDQSGPSTGPMVYTDSQPNNPTLPTQDDWAWNEGMTGTMDDSSWSYLEQFLNLPGDDTVIDL